MPSLAAMRKKGKRNLALTSITKDAGMPSGFLAYPRRYLVGHQDMLVFSDAAPQHMMMVCQCSHQAS